MKKMTKTVIAMACVTTLGAGIVAMAGCSGAKTGEAYALVHGGSYVGKVTLKVQGEKVTDASLGEVCLPTHVTIQSVVGTGADVAAQQEDAVSKIDEAHKTNADYVVDKITDHGSGAAAVYYKSVSYGDVKLTYTAGEGYKDAAGKKLKELLADEANCKVFYEAVMAGNVSVKVGGADKKDVMNTKALYKDENGYWTNVKDKDGNSYSRWKLNRDNTLAYVKANGVANLLKLVRSTEAVEDSKGAQAKYWMAGTVSTGATWSDLNSDTTGKGYLSYAQLIVKAYDAKK